MRIFAYLYSCAWVSKCKSIASHPLLGADDINGDGTVALSITMRDDVDDLFISYGFYKKQISCVCAHVHMCIVSHPLLLIVTLPTLA
eukprot:c54116_g1_i1 orf=105-365(+)